MTSWPSTATMAALRSLPPVLCRRRAARVPRRWSHAPAAAGMPPPLKGVRILDVTRVRSLQELPSVHALSGARRALGACGADVHDAPCRPRRRRDQGGSTGASALRLALMGVQVEEVTRGDDTRSYIRSLASTCNLISPVDTGSWAPPSAPIPDGAPRSAAHLPAESAYFLAANRNKRSLTVNFKKPEGLEIMRKLVERADVMVENYVPGKLHVRPRAAAGVRLTGCSQGHDGPRI
jgi:succinate--hydroxymethylglutarate CoA-transferase